MTWNTKQWKFTDDKIIRSAHGLYLATIYYLVCIPVYPPHLYIFIGVRRGYTCPVAQPNPPQIRRSPLPMYYSVSYSHPENLYRRRIIYLNSKSYLRVIMMEGVAIFPKLFISLTLLVLQTCRHFLLCLIAHAYHVEFQLVIKFLPLDVTVVFLM